MNNERTLVILCGSGNGTQISITQRLAGDGTWSPPIPPYMQANGWHSKGTAHGKTVELGRFYSSLGLANAAASHALRDSPDPSTVSHHVDGGDRQVQARMAANAARELPKFWMRDSEQAPDRYIACARGCGNRTTIPAGRKVDAALLDSVGYVVSPRDSRMYCSKGCAQLSAAENPPPASVAAGAPLPDVGYQRRREQLMAAANAKAKK
jgi:hypothetical protein